MTQDVGLSVALIGVGRMGRAHLQAAKELGVKDVLACDRSEENLRKVAEGFGLPSDALLMDSAELFARRDRIDLVVIAATADSHRDLVVLAAEAGARMILCEKPMATSLADCDAMIKACAKAGARLAINHQMRFMDQYCLVREELDGGRFGALASMNVVGGCFGLSMNGSHYFEAFRYLTGSEISEVTAWFSPQRLSNPRGPNFFDQAGEVRAVSTNGQRFNMEIGADQGHGMTVMYAARHGHIFVDELEAVYSATARQPEYLDQPTTRYGMPWDRWENRFRQADNVQPTREVMEALIAGRNSPSGEDGRRIVAALVAAYKSVDNGNVAVAVADLDDYYDKRFPWA